MACAAGPAHSGDTFCGTRRQIHVLPPRVERGPVVDGRLDDPVWSQAAVLDSFTQAVPIEGVPDSLGTECLVVYDAQNLYVGFRCRDDPQAVQAPVTPRDNSWQGDYVCVSIDGFGDHQRSQFFCANASGIQMDGMDVDGQDESDLAPDFLYVSKGSRTARGWEAELAIPFTSLRFPAHDPLSFGFNVSRQVKRMESNLFWAPVTRNINSYHAQMGTLDRLEGLRPGRNLQLNPVFTTTRSGERGGDDLRYDDDPRFGLGVKYGITTGLTADATLSPDFSQVEADAGVVDVNERFAIYFPEKRPFFLEGSDIFRTPSNLVYTRQIVDPRYGGKLSGKLGRMSLGAIFAADRAAGEAPESIPDGMNPYRDHDSFASILRLKHDVLRNSFVGALATAREQLDSYGRDVGIDGRINIRDRWSAAFQGIASWTRSRDYLQRQGWAPVGTAEYDSIRAANPARTADGRSGTLELTRTSEHLDADFELATVSPGFVADLGFVPRTDFTSVSASIHPHLIASTPTWYTGIHPQLDAEQIYTYGGHGRLTDNDWRLGLELRMPRGTYAAVGYRRVFTNFDGARFPGQGRIELSAGSSRFQVVRTDASFAAGDNVLFDEGVRGRFLSLDVSSDLRFSQQLDGTLSIKSERDRRSDDDSRYADVLIPRLRLSYQFTKELAFRLIGEWNSEVRWDRAGAFVSRDRNLSLDGLASYVLKPGTVVYLGYGSRLSGEEPRALVVGRNNLFVKLSYLWQD
jgi:hypothetical protein